MICPKCDSVTKHRDASSYSSSELKCSSCSYVYALDPKRMGFGDRRIWKVAEKLSKGGRYFTEQQLACACLSKSERKITTGTLTGAICGLIALILFTIGGTPIPLSLIIGVVLGLIIGVIFTNSGEKAKLWTGVQSYCYKKGHQFLITPKNAEAIIGRLEKKNKITFQDFNPDKALIVDDLEFVALLLLNDFHRDSNCLVLSENNKSGPFYEYFVKRQQSENKLPVFAVHDGGAEEEIMVSRIKKDPKWIGCEEITDLGLSREILTDYKSGTWINERSGSVQAHSPKKIDEKYKASWVFPVDCIPPEKLNLSLNACMAGGFAMLSPQMFGAIGMAPAATSSNTSSGDGTYYGDSGSSTSFSSSDYGGGAGFEDFG